MALFAAALLVLAGVGLAWFYVGSWSGVYGTTYGVMLVAKCCLLLAMVGLGAGNWALVRRLASDPKPLLARLRRVGEAEIAAGIPSSADCCFADFSAPAADLAAAGRLTPREIYARMRPESPAYDQSCRRLRWPLQVRSKWPSRKVSSGLPSAATRTTKNGQSTTITGQGWLC